MMDPQMLQKLQQMIFARQGGPGMGMPPQRPAAPAGLPAPGGMPTGGMPAGGMPGAAPGGAPGGAPNPQMLMQLLAKLGMGGSGRPM